MQETKNNGTSQHFSSHHDWCSKYSKVKYKRADEIMQETHLNFQ